MRIGEFAQFCRLLALNKGSSSNAVAMAEGARVPHRVVSALKAAVSAGGAGGPGAWAIEGTQPLRLLASAFQEQLRFSSAFARMADGAIVRTPLDVIVGAVASSTVAAVHVDAGEPLPVLRADMVQVTVPRRKAGAIMTLTDELLTAAASAESLITRVLRMRVSEAVDSDVFSTLLSGVTPFTGTTLLQDVRTLLNAVDLTSASRPFFCCSADVAIRMATEHTSGTRHFPDATALRGSLIGVPLLVTSALQNMLVLVDAARVAGDLETPVVSISTQGTLQMDDAPTSHGGTGSPIEPVATTQVSLWQLNLSGIKVTAYFGVAKLDAHAVASVYSGGSP